MFHKVEHASRDTDADVPVSIDVQDTGTDVPATGTDVQINNADVRAA